MPFASGHVLALRVFPENSFAPYRTVWHRDPEGRWSIYVDGASLDTACPRYFGPACDHVAHARIDLEWTGPASLRVRMDQPHLEWTLTAAQTPVLRGLNALSSRLPLWTWRFARLVRSRELLARRLLHLGDIRMSGPMPSGHEGLLMPQRMYIVTETRAALDGTDLGPAAQGGANPMIGDVPLPSRGVVAIGGGVWQLPS
ncbi:MAG TPA: hypothetical protein VM097_11420 [Mycobacteriales bacterium]|nr:hypothetical protein [Mycobacteriales bacterium]